MRIWMVLFVASLWCVGCASPHCRQLERQAHAQARLLYLCQKKIAELERKVQELQKGRKQEGKKP